MAKLLGTAPIAAVVGAAALSAALSAAGRLQSLAAAERPTAAVRDALPARVENESAAQLASRVAELIELLGHEQYWVRQRAQAELARIGAPAFEALTLAVNHDDIEIAARAQYLVNQIRIDWTRDTDSAAVKKLLENYDLLDEAGRINRLVELARLPGDVGVEPLCRLLRFERSPMLSKHCALLIMGQPERPAKAWQARAQVVESTLRGSSRPAARWLRTYYRFRDDPKSAMEEWNQLIDEEIAALDEASADAQRTVVLMLEQQLVKLLLELDDRPRALEIMRNVVAMETDDTESLRMTANWLIQHKAWEVVGELAERFAGTFRSDPLLGYSLAYAKHQQGETEEAEKLAADASSLVAAGSFQHLQIAAQLQERGLFTWSEREYRRFLEAPAADVGFVITARTLFAEMLHDLERHRDAALVLQKLSDAMQKNPEVLHRVQQDGRGSRGPGAIRSRMHYFYAKHYEAENDQAARRKHLEAGLAHDKTDADVLIGLYQISADDPAMRKRTLQLIEAAAEQFRREIEQQPEDSNSYNQYAWLIGNTEGDYDLAIQYSHKSLELRPGTAGFLDTLAHCYAAKGDYENAVKYQTEAVNLDPHTQQISRALKRFKHELEKKHAAAGE